MPERIVGYLMMIYELQTIFGVEDLTITFR